MVALISAPPPRLIEGAGTTESIWLEGARFDDVAVLDVDGLVARHPVAWIVAPHPDDEVLGVGGLMALLAARGVRIHVVSVTDGSASHPGSTRWTPRSLASARRRELQGALSDLGERIVSMRLGLPDGSVTAHRAEVEEFLETHCQPEDLVVTTWRLDGHPDHEACGNAAVAAAARIGAETLEYPVWAWHWASPVAAEFPWERARRVDLGASLRIRKRAAIGNFTSQLDSDDHRPAVLPAHVLERFHRPFEIVFS